MIHFSFLYYFIIKKMQHQILKALSIQDLHQYCHPPEIDVVISVGGFYGYYAVGVQKILQKLENQGKIRIRRYAGASVGAICAVLMACNTPPEIVIGIYDALLFKKQYLFELKKKLLEILPYDAHHRCSGKVFINATRITLYGLRKIVFSQYRSNQELVDVCMASSCLPFYVSPHLFYRFDGDYYVDGCFTDMLPVFQDRKHHQLLIKLYKINYYTPYALCPSDPSIEGLIVKGAVEMNKFLTFRPDYIKTLEWFDETKIQLKWRRRMQKLILSALFLILLTCCKKKRGLLTTIFTALSLCPTGKNVTN